MEFLALPVEIRLEIYSILLTRPGSITFWERRDGLTLRRYCSGTNHLSPAILVANKQVYREAVGLLYSSNRFRFPGVSKRGPSQVVCVEPLLRQIGARHASLIRYIGIPFPSPYRRTYDLPGRYFEMIRLLRDVCTSVTAVELILPPGGVESLLDLSTRDMDDMLGRIDAALKTILSLRKVVVAITVPFEDGQKHSIPEDAAEFGNLPVEDVSDDEWETPEERLTEKLQRRGWTVRTLTASSGARLSDPLVWGHRAERQLMRNKRSRTMRELGFGGR